MGDVLYEGVLYECWLRGRLRNAEHVRPLRSVLRGISTEAITLVVRSVSVRPQHASPEDDAPTPPATGGGHKEERRRRLNHLAVDFVHQERFCAPDSDGCELSYTDLDWKRKRAEHRQANAEPAKHAHHMQNIAHALRKTGVSADSMSAARTRLKEKEDVVRTLMQRQREATERRDALIWPWAVTYRSPAEAPAGQTMVVQRTLQGRADCGTQGAPHFWAGMCNGTIARACWQRVWRCVVPMRDEVWPDGPSMDVEVVVVVDELPDSWVSVNPQPETPGCEVRASVWIRSLPGEQARAESALSRVRQSLWEFVHLYPT